MNSTLLSIVTSLHIDDIFYSGKYEGAGVFGVIEVVNVFKRFLVYLIIADVVLNGIFGIQKLLIAIYLFIII